MELFGWLYNAEQVAEYERIKLNDVFEMPVIQFLNGLSYLKSKGQHQKRLNARHPEF